MAPREEHHVATLAFIASALRVLKRSERRCVLADVLATSLVVVGLTELRNDATRDLIGVVDELASLECHPHSQVEILVGYPVVRQAWAHLDRVGVERRNK